MEEGSRTHPRALWIGTGEAGLEEQVQILGTENRGAWVRVQWRLLCKKWRKWLESPFYRLIVLYRLGGLKALVDDDVGRNNIRRI
jgi:hypothetical protein